MANTEDKDSSDRESAGEKEPPAKDQPVGKNGSAKVTAATDESPTQARGLSTLTWLLPAATFLIGLLIGFAVWGATGNDDDGGRAETAPSVTGSPSAEEGNGRTATVTVPQSCLDAIESSERSLALVEEAVAAIGELDAGRLQEIVDELQDLSEQTRELGDECQETADITVGTPSSPTS